ncbi:AAA family ATPase [Breznakiella homolactica]|uniref:AAA family ATPase n=1 Tax=Breznakiella homolactica TaxID=2798577 RepID=A0A7T7XPZ1_9SPIR|nr:AAA family ATPase [Breznakiella homolactica]QQO10379.1 ATP-binding protein [Breznakiella homolactica]
MQLSYSKNNSKAWSFIGKKGFRNIKGELTEKIVSAVRTSVKYKYLPVGRDISYLIKNELSNELIQILFGGYSGAVEYRRKINISIENLLSSLKPKLDEGSEGVTSTMKEIFEEVSKLSLGLPFNSLETLISELKIEIADEYQTPISSKGAGLQTSSLIFLLKYIADNYPQRHNSISTYIWAIEEPESFLHPRKQREMARTLKSFTNEI